MRLRPSFLAVLAVLAAPAAAAQAGGQPGVPRAILEDIARSHGGDAHSFGNADSLARYTRLELRDLNRDGRPEYLVSTGLMCGATWNCSYWVYARRPGGRFRRLLEASGARLDFLRTRTNGWLDAEQRTHFSAVETYRSSHAFDGRRYEWTGTELRGRGDSVLHLTWLHLAGASTEPRTASMRVTPRGGRAVRVSGEYTACRPQHAVPGRLCGEPRLVLTWAPPPRGRPGRPPWTRDERGICFDLTVVPWEGTAERKGRMCARGEAGKPVTAPVPGELELTAHPGVWSAIANSRSFRLRIGGVDLPFERELADAVRQFVGAVHHLNGIERRR